MEYTRAQRLNNECTHEEYWDQFVTEAIIRLVKGRFGGRLDTVTLAEWDSLSLITRELIDKDKWRRLMCPKFIGTRSYAWSLSDNICILKQAASRIKVDA
jgi:hypothetical protein